MTRVVFLVLPGVQLLELAGPVQAIHQANLDWTGYEAEFVGGSGEAESAQGLFLSRLGELDDVAPGKADTVSSKRRPFSSRPELPCARRVAAARHRSQPRRHASRQ